jgi:hypothetical protein
MWPNVCIQDVCTQYYMKYVNGCDLSYFPPSSNFMIDSDYCYRYLSERFNFLEKCPGYLYNNGLGTSLVSNSVALGSTLVDAMITEVKQMCDLEEWSEKAYQQVFLYNIYILYIYIYL